MVQRSTSFFQQRSFLGIVLLIAIIVLSGCGVRQGGTWPAASAQGDQVYIAYEAQILAVDVPENRVSWAYEGTGATRFFSAPSVVDDRIVFADFGRQAGLLNFEGLVVSLYSLSNLDGSEPVLVYPEPQRDVVTGRVVAEGTIYNDTYFVGTSDNHVVAVDWTDGTRKWPEDFIADNSIWSKPLIHNDILYITSLDGNIYALNPEDGALLWKSTLDGAVSSSPQLSFDESSLLVGSFSGQMASVDLDSGEFLWISEAEDWIWSTPVLIDERAIYVDASGTIYDVDQASGEILQTKAGILSNNVTGDPLLVDDKILFVSTVKDNLLESGTLTAVSVSDFETVWTYSTDNGGFNSAPVYAGERIVLPYIDNEFELQIVSVDPSSGDGRLVAPLTQ